MVPLAYDLLKLSIPLSQSDKGLIISRQKTSNAIR